MVARAEIAPYPKQPIFAPAEGPEKKNRRKKEPITIPPSKEYAWMLGVVSGGGHNNPKGQISIYSTDDLLINNFNTIGESLFNTHPKGYRHSILIDGRIYKTATFLTTSAGSALGDLRREQWPQTLLETHSWVFQDQTYAKGFLEGFSEMRCRHVTTTDNYENLHIATKYPHVADALETLLTTIGINEAQRTYRERDGLTGIIIGTQTNVNTFATQIHSVIPEKERRLEICRTLEYRDKLPPSSYVLDWKKAQDYLKGPPTYKKLRELYQSGLTVFSPSAYTSRFETRFSDVKSTLQSILSGDDGLLNARLQELDACWDIEQDKEAIAFYERRIAHAARYNLEDKFAERQKDRIAQQLFEHKETLAQGNRQFVVEQANTVTRESNLHAYLPYVRDMGMNALRSAIDTFTWRNGERLIDYASPYIKETITNTIQEVKQRLENHAEITIQDGWIKANDGRKIRLTGEELELLIVLANNLGDPVQVPHTFMVHKLKNIVQSLTQATIKTTDFTDTKTGATTSESKLHGRIIVAQ